MTVLSCKDIVEVSYREEEEERLSVKRVTERVKREKKTALADLQTE